MWFPRPQFIVLWWLLITVSPSAFPDDFSSWRQQHFTPAQLDDQAISGPQARPLRDGVPNLIKYALGMSPWSQPQPFLPRFFIDEDGFPSCQFSQNLAATDITYVVETSTNLNRLAARSTVGAAA